MKNIEEQKMRTRSSIEHSELVTKAQLNHLSSNTLYGALLSLTKQLNEIPDIQSEWSKNGSHAFHTEQKDFTAVILKLHHEPKKNIRDSLRSFGLKFNRFRQEWYGNVQLIDQLKLTLKNIKHELEMLD